ncbi:N-acetyl-gamma-glutamyl-phosphate reductase, partial [bacterium]|nr:N-acetyl-gamma-glutamyl-phosphate reductase [bacterium]
RTVELPGGGEVTFVATEQAPLADAQLIFSSLPHGASKAWVEKSRAAGAKVVDLSHDLRIGNGVDGVVYGLTELYRDQIRGADIVANPGCYPTSISLALLPLIEQGLIAHHATIIANSASGVTGAGFTARTDLLFGEITENYRAYGTGNTHRHLNEMRALLGTLQSDAELVFTPHLLPIARGILSSITVPLRGTLDDAMAPFRSRYGTEPFIELASAPPELRHVTGRNTVRIFAQPLAHLKQPTLLILSAIDNLMKGAAGQAVQNANLMLGLEETAGLPV